MVSAFTAAGVRFRVLSTRLLTRLGFRDETFLVLVAVFVGVVTAAAAVAFHELIVRLREALFAAPGQQFLYGRGLWLLVLWPALGGLVVGVLSKHVFAVKGIHGLADVMESVIRGRGFTRPGVAVEKILTSGITIGTGGSVGAEAPIVQIGAAIASAVGRVFGLAARNMPLVVGCGSVAGISAIFNSPIGGVLFTLEVILQDFSIRTFAPLVVASVVANVTTQAIFRHVTGKPYEAIFNLPDAVVRAQPATTWGHLPFFLLLGVACGLLGVAFTKLMIRMEHAFERLRVPAFAKPAIGGALLGVAGVGYVLMFGHALLGQIKPIPFEQYPMPAFFSDGYGAIQAMLTPGFYAQWPARTLLVFLAGLLVIKVLAAATTVSSGGGGGVIGPALFLGAVSGGLLGELLRLAGADLHPSLYALVGMAAVLSAVVHAPMASIVILLEVTHDYKLTLPAMLAAVTAVGVARVVFRDSLYTTILRARGLYLGPNSDLRLLRRLSVEHLALEPAEPLHGRDPINTVFGRIDRSGVTDFAVVDDAGAYAGMVVAEDLVTALRGHEASALLLVADLVRPEIRPVRADDDLATVFDRFATTDVDRLPVVSTLAPGRVIGMVTRGTLIRRYRSGLGEE